MRAAIEKVKGQLGQEYLWSSAVSASTRTANWTVSIRKSHSGCGNVQKATKELANQAVEPLMKLFKRGAIPHRKSARSCCFESPS